MHKIPLIESHPTAKAPWVCAGSSRPAKSWSNSSTPSDGHVRWPRRPIGEMDGLKEITMVETMVFTMKYEGFLRKMPSTRMKMIKKVWEYMFNLYGIVIPKKDGKVNHRQISRDLLFRLFGDDVLIYMEE